MLQLKAEVRGLRRQDNKTVIQTTAGDFRASYVVNCAGLYSDVISNMAGAKLNLKIVPFRGEYYEIVPMAAFERHFTIYQSCQNSGVSTPASNGVVRAKF